MTSFNAAHIAAIEATSRQRQRTELLGLNAFDRHKRFVHDLVTYYGGNLPERGTTLQSAAAGGGGVGVGAAVGAVPIKTDEDSLRESYRFIRSEEDDAEDSWEVRLAKKYYSRLFREYCIADLSRYKEGQLGLRWRAQKEVVSGRGQFICGARGCEERRGLSSFEVPFGYEEDGKRKQALVKVRVCPEHAYQLSYKKNKGAEKRQEGKRKYHRKDKSKSRRRKKSKRENRYGTSSSGSDWDTNDSRSSGNSSEDEKEEREPRHRRRKDHRTSEDELAKAVSKKESYQKRGLEGKDGGSKNGNEGGFDELFAGMFE